MTHRELVQKAREAGLVQCKGTYWRDKDGKMLLMSKQNLPRVSSCCELGLIYWGEMSGHLTEIDVQNLYIGLFDPRRSNGVALLNDLDGYSWEQFTELLETPV